MLTRRDLLAISWVCVLGANAAHGDGQDSVTVSIRVDESVSGLLQPLELENLSVKPDQSQEAETLANSAPPGRAIPIILIIVGAFAAVRLLELIQELYRKTFYGGVLIDTRANPPFITNDMKIPASMVFVIRPDGNTIRFAGDKFELTDLMAVLGKK